MWSDGDIIISNLYALNSCTVCVLKKVATRVWHTVCLPPPAFLFWTDWAEVLLFCSSVRLDGGGGGDGGRAGGERSKQRRSFTFWNKQEARPRSCPPARLVLRRETVGLRVLSVAHLLSFSRETTLPRRRSSNINFQLCVRPVHASTTPHHSD